MRTLAFSAAILLGVPAIAAAEGETLAAHVHGTGTLNIAVDGNDVFAELIAPGADIVGFEHQPSSDDDHAAIDAAVDKLRDTGMVFGFPSGAGCSLTEVDIESGLLGDDNHDHGDDHAHAEKNDDHDDHAHGKKHDDDHAHGEKHEDDDDHAHSEKHEDDHGHAHGEKHEDDDDHAHSEKHDDDHDHAHSEKRDDHDDHAHAGEVEAHAEFHVTFKFTCSDPTALTHVDLPYFQTFSGADALNVQALGPNGQAGATLTREESRITF